VALPHPSRLVGRPLFLRACSPAFGDPPSLTPGPCALCSLRAPLQSPCHHRSVSCCSLPWMLMGTASCRTRSWCVRGRRVERWWGPVCFHRRCKKGEWHAVGDGPAQGSLKGTPNELRVGPFTSSSSGPNTPHQRSLPSPPPFTACMQVDVLEPATLTSLDSAANAEHMYSKTTFTRVTKDQASRLAGRPMSANGTHVQGEVVDKSLPMVRGVAGVPRPPSSCTSSLVWGASSGQGACAMCV
jgi:hypothetical protein